MLAARIPSRQPRFTRRLAALAVGLGLAASVATAGTVTAAEDTSIELALVVPIVVPAGSEGILDAAALAQYTTPSGLLTRQLDATIGRPVALAIDPMIIASIRLLGDSVPSATQWLERLASAPNESFALAWSDADLTLPLQSGAATVPIPESLDFAVDPALFAPEPAASGDPAGDDDPLPDYPTTTQLLEWQYSLDAIAWPRDDSIVASDIPALAASGYVTTIVSSTNLTRDASSSSAATVGDELVLVSDATISAAVRAAALAQDEAGWDAAMTTVSDSLTAASRILPGPTATVLATLDRSAPLSGSRLGETLDALAANPSVSLVSVSGATTGRADPATIIDRPQGDERVSQAGQLLATEAADHRFASIAQNPALITSEWRLRLLALLSNAWVAEPENWGEASNGFITDSVELRTSVAVSKSGNFLLVADNNQFLPITVSNDLAQSVTVYVTVKPDTALLSIDDQRVELTVDAGAQGKVDVPVRSLSNGIVEIEVTLTSGSGVTIGSPVRAEVNVQAGWETPIVVAIGALVVIVFAVGIVRTVLRRRRDADV